MLSLSKCPLGIWNLQVIFIFMWETPDTDQSKAVFSYKGSWGVDGGDEKHAR